MHKKNKRIKEKNKRIKNLLVTNNLLAKLYIFEIDNSYHDFLSGLLNRRGFFYYLSLIKGAYIISLIDIDFFKSINDTLGHLKGDASIILVSNLLNQVFKSDNTIISRFGGDEFLLLSKDLSIKALLNKLNYLKDIIFKKSKVEIGTSITISIGVAYCNDKDTFDDVFSKVDKALYTSKINGKNTITLYGIV